MKKSLIALAALATVGAAQAQSSVTVYGLLDAGYSDMKREAQRIDVNGASTVLGNTQQAFTFNNLLSSRFGIRGSEDLGGGMRADFVIETAISSNPMAGYSQTAVPRRVMELGNDLGSSASNNGTTIDGTSLGNRELNARLTTKSGTTLGIGFGSTAIRDIALAHDAAFGGNLVGNIITNDAQFSSNRATGIAIGQRLGDFRVGAGITKNNADFTGTASSPLWGETKTSTGYLLNASYAKGPLSLAAATQVSKTKTNATAASDYLTVNGSSNACAIAGGAWADVGVTTSTNGGTVNQCSFAAGLATDVKRTTNIVAGSYNFGVAQVYGTYGSVKTEDAQTVNATGEGKRSGYVVGARVPVGKFTAFASYSNGKQEQVTAGATASTAGHAAVSRDITGYQLGGRYDLSKRTFAYVAYGETKLDTAATTGTNGSGSSAIRNDRNYGLKVQQTTAGLVHSF